MVERRRGQLSPERKERLFGESKELTPQDINVLNLKAQGNTHIDVGKKLFITINTVKTHIGNIAENLDGNTMLRKYINGLQLGYIDIHAVIASADITKLKDLTSREEDVLKAMIKSDEPGDQNQLVSKKLRISENTVKSHVLTIFSKLGTNNRNHAAFLYYINALPQEEQERLQELYKKKTAIIRIKHFSYNERMTLARFAYTRSDSETAAMIQDQPNPAQYLDLLYAKAGTSSLVETILRGIDADVIPLRPMLAGFDANQLKELTPSEQRFLDKFVDTNGKPTSPEGKKMDPAEESMVWTDIVKKLNSSAGFHPAILYYAYKHNEQQKQ